MLLWRSELKDAHIVSSVKEKTSSVRSNEEEEDAPMGE